MDSRLWPSATRFNAVEINSSFYRPHQPGTYERWAASVAEHFRFAVKVPKEITHKRRLQGAEELLDRFLSECTMLGDRLGPLLVQLPPSFRFDAKVVAGFLRALRDHFDGDVVWEPRHPTWFTDEAEALLAEYRVARVAADPAVIPAAGEPGGWPGLDYYRLHGAPKMYYSDYPADYLSHLRGRIERQARSVSVLCIFDNTALGAATANALRLSSELGLGRTQEGVIAKTAVTAMREPSGKG